MTLPSFGRLVLLAGAAGVAVSGELLAQSSELRGRVVTESGVPIVGATVTLTGVRYSVRTDSLGQFHFAGTPGSTLSLALHAAGYRDETASVVLGRGRPTTRDFVLASETTALPEVNPSDRVLRIRATTTAGEPIAYANLQVNGGRRFVSDDSGRFAVPITVVGSAKLLLRRIGFEPTEMTLTAMPDTTVRVAMDAVARTLETQMVTVRSPFIRLDMGGFYKRMAEVQNGARVGYFVTPEDLELRKPQNVTDAVEQFPNIRLAPIDDGKRDASGAHADGAMSRRKFRIEDRNGCPLTVYLDRIRIQPSLAGGKEVDEEINSLVNPGSVAGIEVYPREVGAPAEFPPANTNSLSHCGVVLIWTR
jgi:hypothetical protein